ncbi:MAG: hypothetical protein ACLRR3_03750 [Eubacterium sp.]
MPGSYRPQMATVRAWCYAEDQIQSPGAKAEVIEYNPRFTPEQQIC